LAQATLLLDGDPAPRPQKGAELPKFLAHVYCGQTSGWIKMVLGLSPGDFVLNGDPARPLIFWPMFITVIVISLEHCTGVSHYQFVQVHSTHSVFRKFNRTQSVL